VVNPTSSTARRVGRSQRARRPAAAAAHCGTTSWYTEPVGATRWVGLIAELATAGAAFAGDLAAARDDLVALERVLEPAARVRTCHRDLWADNVRATAAGELCVVDWDNCGGAGPAHELALVLFEFGNGDPARARTLDGAYRAAGGPARVCGRGDFSMLIAQLGHIVEWSIRRWLDPATPPAERQRQACPGHRDDLRPADAGRRGRPARRRAGGVPGTAQSAVTRSLRFFRDAWHRGWAGVRAGAAACRGSRPPWRACSSAPCRCTWRPASRAGRACPRTGWRTRARRPRGRRSPPATGSGTTR
jgi:phosphotransferase family enzyme